MKKFAILLLVISSHVVLGQRAVPPLWGHRIHDEANILSPGAVDSMENLLKQHEDSTSNQIAVLIIPSLDGEVLEEYALRVSNDEWKLGKSNNDNGVLLLIAVNDRKMRIEVGQGLEGVLTDATTSRIIRNEVAPNFRDQNYDAGVEAGLRGIIAAIGGEYTDAVAEDSLEVDLTWKERLLIGAFIFGILGVFTFFGIFIQGCMGWFMYAFLIPFYAMFPMAVLGVRGGMAALVIYVIAFPLLKLILGRSAWGKKLSGTMADSSRRSGGGWTSGGGWFSGGTSRGGGWSSGGGFSGGGGSFGGGGSSGSW